jgi:hypothetical protein
MYNSLSLRFVWKPTAYAPGTVWASVVKVIWESAAGRLWGRGFRGTVLHKERGVGQIKLIYGGVCTVVLMQSWNLGSSKRAGHESMPGAHLGIVAALPSQCSLYMQKTRGFCARIAEAQALRRGVRGPRADGRFRRCYWSVCREVINLGKARLATF